MEVQPLITLHRDCFPKTIFWKWKKLLNSLSQPIVWGLWVLTLRLRFHNKDSHWPSFPPPSPSHTTPWAALQLCRQGRTGVWPPLGREGFLGDQLHFNEQSCVTQWVNLTSSDKSWNPSSLHSMFLFPSFPFLVFPLHPMVHCWHSLCSFVKQTSFLNFFPPFSASQSSTWQKMNHLKPDWLCSQISPQPTQLLTPRASPPALHPQCCAATLLLLQFNVWTQEKTLLSC